MKRLRWLAVSSSGGHWVQLRRLRQAWSDGEVVYVTTNADSAFEVADEARRFHCVRDANRHEPIAFIQQVLQVIWILIRERPDVVISTGASVGFVALYVGKLLRARTIWLDSIANAEELSMSGRGVRWCADLWLTQWPHLAEARGSGQAPRYEGSVL
jgi:UDP-N-acetylglucosamine:LPS N-acetylglucosamine transferase